MKINRTKLSKKDWYAKGGFANSRLFRKGNRNGSWSYWMTND